MAQNFISFANKHAVAGSTRLAATTATGGDGIQDIKISLDLDNGTIIGKGALVAGQVYAMAAPTTFTGVILPEKAANGNYLVEVTAAENAYLVLTVPSTPIDYTNAMRAESTFYNEKNDIVRAYPLVARDVFELSKEGFDGVPAANKTVSVDASTYKVEVQ